MNLLCYIFWNVILGAFWAEPFRCRVSSFLEPADYHVVFHSQLRCSRAQGPGSVPGWIPEPVANSILVPTLPILCQTKYPEDWYKLYPLHIDSDSIAHCSRTCSVIVTKMIDHSNFRFKLMLFINYQTFNWWRIRLNNYNDSILVFM